MVLNTQRGSIRFITYALQKYPDLVRGLDSEMLETLEQLAAQSKPLQIELTFAKQAWGTP